MSPFRKVLVLTQTGKLANSPLIRGVDAVGGRGVLANWLIHMNELHIYSYNCIYTLLGMSHPTKTPRQPSGCHPSYKRGIGRLTLFRVDLMRNENEE